MTLTKWMALGIGLLLPTLAFTQVVSVPFKEKDVLFSDAPNLNFLWPAQQAKATLIFVQGGEGRLGITPDRKNLGGFYGSTLRPLSDPQLTRGGIHVVVFDSPVNLPGTDYPTSRQNMEHLLRIESVVRHFKDLYGLPVWIMGHSNGAVSITEFYKMLQKSQKEGLVSGAIFSAARNGADFNDTTQLPILFLAHERKQCSKTLPARTQAVFDQQRKSNTLKTEFVLIKGGQAQAQNPCSSGFHMFFGASEEAYMAIERFVLGPPPP
jgi:hypothetical protein